MYLGVARLPFDLCWQSKEYIYIYRYRPLVVVGVTTAQFLIARKLIPYVKVQTWLERNRDADVIEVQNVKLKSKE